MVFPNPRSTSACKRVRFQSGIAGQRPFHNHLFLEWGIVKRDSFRVADYTDKWNGL